MSRFQFTPFFRSLKFVSIDDWFNSLFLSVFNTIHYSIPITNSSLTELSTGHFSWTRPDPTRWNVDPTRPVIAEKSLTRPAARPSPPPREWEKDLLRDSSRPASPTRQAREPCRSDPMYTSSILLQLFIKRKSWSWSGIVWLEPTKRLYQTGLTNYIAINMGFHFNWIIIYKPVYCYLLNILIKLSIRM